MTAVAGVKLTPEAAESCVSSPWLADASLEDIANFSNVSTNPHMGQATRQHSRIMRCLEFQQAGVLHRGMQTASRQSTFLSAGGPQSGKTWANLPSRADDYMDNDHFRMAAMLRLGAVGTPLGAFCQLTKKDDEPCLAALDSPLIHPAVCKFGPARLRPHRSVAHRLAKELRSTGAQVDHERAVPQLCSVNEDIQQIQESILGVVVSWPGGTRQCFLDVTIRSAHSDRYSAPHTALLEWPPAPAIEKNVHVTATL